MTKNDGLSPDPRIAEGERLLSLRRFADAYDVLDKAQAGDRRNPRISVLLGIACLYQDFLEDAEHFFRKAVELDLDNTDARSGLAFVLMRTDRVAEATEELCDILRVRPMHTFARKRFKELKKTASIEAYIAGIHPSMFVALPARKRFGFLEKIHIPPVFRRIAIVSILLCVAVLVYLCTARRQGVSFWDQLFSPKTSAPDPYYPSGTILETDLGKSLSRAIQAAAHPPEIFLSDPEVSSLLTRARQLLNDGEYNEARYLLNRLLASNADRISIDLARQMDAFIKAPSAERMHFNPDVPDVFDEGFLYRGVYVKWLTRVVQATNGVFLQVAPARYHGNEDDSVQVVVVEENAHAFTGGTTLEVYGDVLGVDTLDTKQKVIYIHAKQVTRLDRDR